MKMKRVQATLKQLEQMIHDPVEDGYDLPALFGARVFAAIVVVHSTLAPVWFLFHVLVV